MATTENLKAYRVSCVDPDHGEVVVFASTAKKVCWYNSEHCDCEFIDRKVHRAPQFDKYAPGPVTVKDYLDEGWYWGCAGHCGNQHVDSDDPYVVVNDNVFCSESCLRETCAEYQVRYAGTGWHESITEARDAMIAKVAELDAAAAEPTK